MMDEVLYGRIERRLDRLQESGHDRIQDIRLCFLMLFAALTIWNAFTWYRLEQISQQVEACGERQ